jgi:protein-disulfide isomerase
MTRKNYVFLTAGIAVIAVAGYFAFSARPAANPALEASATAPAAGEASSTEPAQAEADAKSAPEAAAPAETPAPAAEAATASAASAAPIFNNGKIDVAAALAPRGEGDPNAPVKIDEYASLSCPHCAHFMKETFPKIDADYIKTGKVYYIFHDFPLNAPAVDGAMVARCMPADKYFGFISFLFETQNDWAFGENTKNSLKQNAKLAGGSDELVDACLANDDLRSGIVKQMADSQKEKNIESTPTFFVNGYEIKGAVGYDVFKDEIEEQLKKK